MRTVFNIVMRIVSSLLGLFMMFAGGVWTLQGLHMAPPPFNGGFMIGDWHWALYGGILFLFGVGQVVWSNTRAR